jgi:hypothetical protein
MDSFFHCSPLVRPGFRSARVSSPAMPATQTPSGAPRAATPRRRATSPFRRTILVLGVIGLTAGLAVISAGSALAGVGSEPGNLKLSPASGAGTLTPGWSTTDGCPAGYRGSAQMAEFTPGGRLISRISPTVAIVTTAFSGTLDGTIGAILRETGVRKGQTVEFAIGCWSLEGGTGKVKYLQSTNVTYSATGTAYTTSTPKGGSGAGSADGQGSYGYYTGQQGSTSGGHSVSATDTANSSGMGAGGLAALIASGCLLVLAGGGYVWHRRRDRSRLM